MDDTTKPSAESLAALLEVLIAGGVTEAEFHENGQPKKLTLSGAGFGELAAKAEDAEPEDTKKRAILKLMGRRT